MCAMLSPAKEMARPVTDHLKPTELAAAAVKDVVLLDTLSHLLRRSHFHAESVFSVHFASTGLTSRQLSLMIAIAQNPEASQKQIGDAVALDVNTVSDTLRRMERKGLVERKSSAVDGRSISVKLTDKGAGLLVHALNETPGFNKRLASRLTDEETQQLKFLTRKLLGLPVHA